MPFPSSFSLLRPFPASSKVVCHPASLSRRDDNLDDRDEGKSEGYNANDDG